MTANVLPTAFRSITTDSERRRLIPAVVALLAIEIAHVGATLANNSQPEGHHPSISRPLHAIAIVTTAALLGWLLARGRWGARLTVLMGGSVAVAAVLYHTVPGDLGV